MLTLNTVFVLYCIVLYNNCYDQYYVLETKAGNKKSLFCFFTFYIYIMFYILVSFDILCLYIKIVQKI